MLGRDSFSASGVFTASFVAPRRSPRRRRGRAHSRSSCLDLVGLAQLADVPMNALPAGHQRLVDVARALALEPYAVLLDEPAAGLDHTETADLGQIIRRMAAAGVAVLLVEHDMRLVMQVADRVVVLDRGRKLADGSPAEVVADQRVLDAYLGGSRHERARRRRERGAQVDGLHAGYGKVPVLRDVSLQVGAGRVRRPAGRQRGRQVDAAQDDRRVAPGILRNRLPRRTRHHQRARRDDRPPRRRARAGGPPAVRRDVRRSRTCCSVRTRSAAGDVTSPTDSTTC